MLICQNVLKVTSENEVICSAACFKPTVAYEETNATMKTAAQSQQWWNKENAMTINSRVGLSFLFGVSIPFFFFNCYLIQMGVHFSGYFTAFVGKTKS